MPEGTHKVCFKKLLIHIAIFKSNYAKSFLTVKNGIYVKVRKVDIVGIKIL